MGLPPGRPPGPDPGPDPGPCPFGLGGCAGLARSKRSSKGARSKRRMIAFISSAFGASINAKPLDSCVSGWRITLIASATKFSALSQPLISSAVTQAGKLPRNTVKLIGDCLQLRWWGFASRRLSMKAILYYHNRQGRKQPAWPAAVQSVVITRLRPSASAKARKSRSRVRRGIPRSIQLWAIKASPRRALRRFASTCDRNAPARCQ